MRIERIESRESAVESGEMAGEANSSFTILNSFANMIVKTLAN